MDIDKKVLTPSRMEKGSESGSYGTFKCDGVTMEVEESRKEGDNGVLMSFLGSLLVVGFLLVVSIVGVGLVWF